MKHSLLAGIFSTFVASALLLSVSSAVAGSTSESVNAKDSAHTDGTVSKSDASNESTQYAKEIAKLQAALKKDHNVPSIGNPDADTTIVEFFDYHCGHCKVYMSSLFRLAKEDKDLRIVLIDFPVLGPESDLAARAALAVNKIDKTKYVPYYRLLMQSFGAFDEERLAKEAVKAGIDEQTFKKAMKDPTLQKMVDNNRNLAHSFGIHWTPSMIVGNEVILGMIDEDDLYAKVAALHKKKN